ncbi:MAG: redoxin family protein [Anaerolineales bacterium]|nr:redoxin family protein [Anaerolineales bacterium]
MRSNITIRTLLPAALLSGFLLVSCSGAPQPPAPTVATQPPDPTSTPAVDKPEWFEYELTDVQTGQTFTMNDYAGKVVLLETMAMWCPNCIRQANEVRTLHELLGNPDDLISVSLDVDVNEDAAALKEYAWEYGFEWHFAIAPLEVARALGNLYSAQYLNPPLSPMLIIDRNGDVHHLEYGAKSAETLLEIVEPYLTE